MSKKSDSWYAFIGISMRYIFSSIRRIEYDLFFCIIDGVTSGMFTNIQARMHAHGTIHLMLLLIPQKNSHYNSPEEIVQFP